MDGYPYGRISILLLRKEERKKSSPITSTSSYPRVIPAYDLYKYLCTGMVNMALLFMHRALPCMIPMGKEDLQYA